MKKFIFLCLLLCYWNCGVKGSKVNPQMPKFYGINTDCLASQNETYNESVLSDDDNDRPLLIELFLDFVHLLIEIEKQECEDDVRIWFENRLNALLILHNPGEYEEYKKSLQEDLEWYGVIYPDLSVINLLKATVAKL